MLPSCVIFLLMHADANLPPQGQRAPPPNRNEEKEEEEVVEEEEDADANLLPQGRHASSSHPQPNGGKHGSKKRKAVLLLPSRMLHHACVTALIIMSDSIALTPAIMHAALMPLITLPSCPHAVDHTAELPSCR